MPVPEGQGPWSGTQISNMCELDFSLVNIQSCAEIPMLMGVLQ